MKEKLRKISGNDSTNRFDSSICLLVRFVIRFLIRFYIQSPRRKTVHPYLRETLINTFHYSFKPAVLPVTVRLLEVVNVFLAVGLVFEYLLMAFNFNVLDDILNHRSITIIFPIGLRSYEYKSFTCPGFEHWAMKYTQSYKE